MLSLTDDNAARFEAGADSAVGSRQMFAGEQKAKIARALGPGSPGFEAFDGIVSAVGRAIDGIPPG